MDVHGRHIHIVFMKWDQIYVFPTEVDLVGDSLLNFYWENSFLNKASISRCLEDRQLKDDLNSLREDEVCLKMKDERPNNEIDVTD